VNPIYIFEIERGKNVLFRNIISNNVLVLIRIQKCGCRRGGGTSQKLKFGGTKSNKYNSVKKK
jgi:hypothetical protein